MTQSCLTAGERASQVKEAGIERGAFKKLEESQCGWCSARGGRGERSLLAVWGEGLELGVT